MFFLDGKVSDQRNQLFENGTSLNGHQERVVFRKQKSTSVSADAKDLIAHETVDKTFLDGVHKALALYKTAPQQHVTANNKYGRRFFPDKNVLETEFNTFSTEMYAKIDGLQTCLGGETKRSSYVDIDCIKVLF